MKILSKVWDGPFSLADDRASFCVAQRMQGPQVVEVDSDSEVLDSHSPGSSSSEVEMEVDPEYEEVRAYHEGSKKFAELISSRFPLSLPS